MATKFFESKNVKVFPCSYRGTYGGNTTTFDPEARLNTEFNFIHSSMVNGNNDSYVIDYNNGLLKCVIGGYYFEISNLQLKDLKDGNDIYSLYIKTKEIEIKEADNTDSSRKTYVLCDNDGGLSLDKLENGSYYFKGLTLSTTAVDGAICLNVIDSNANILESSKLVNWKHGVGKYSAVLGGNEDTDKSTADGEYAIAVGKKVNASGVAAVAIGDNTQATADAAVALGLGTKAGEIAMTAVGKYNKSEEGDLFVVGNGASDTDRSNLFRVATNGIELNKNTKISGATEITGAVTINIPSGADKSFKINAEGEKDFEITQNGDLTASGNITLGDKADNVKIGQEGKTAKFIGNVEIAQKITVTDEAEIVNKLTAKNGVAITNGLTADTATITNGLTAANNKFSIDGTSGSVTITDGNLNVATGNITANDISGATNKATILVRTDQTTKDNTTYTTGEWRGDLPGSYKSVWGESFKYKDWGTDTGDINYLIRKNGSSQELCVLIDGDYYANSKQVLHDGDNKDIEIELENGKITGKTIIAETINSTGDNGFSAKKISVTDKITTNNLTANGEVILGNTTGNVTLSKAAENGNHYTTTVNDVLRVKGNLALDGAFEGKELKLTGVITQNADSTASNIFNSNIGANKGIKITGVLSSDSATGDTTTGLSVTNNIVCENTLIGKGLKIQKSDSTKASITEDGQINGTSIVSSGSISANSITTTNEKFKVTDTGEVSGLSFESTSDIRKKKNIKDYIPESSILELPLKKFDYIDGPKNQIGCIAQDLQKICPEIVSEDEEGYLRIQESKLVYLLLDEVKKLKKEVEDLKAGK